MNRQWFGWIVEVYYVTIKRMRLNMHFDADRAMKTIEEICRVSEFVDPADPGWSNSWKMERYLRRGKRRLAVVSQQFEQLGYRTITQEFDFGGLNATNALFAQGEISDGVILFAAHHDYCAGLGAVDNASALSIMLELARCLEEKELGVMFASFDLEEVDLSGSRHFVASSAAKEFRALTGVIALECIGSGRDVVICKQVAGAKSDPVLIESLLRAGRKLRHRILLESFDWFNADHVPFAELGISTAEVCSYNSENYKGRPAPNVNIAHSNLDVPENVRPDTLKIVGEVLLQFLNDLSRAGEDYTKRYRANNLI